MRPVATGSPTATADGSSGGIEASVRSRGLFERLTLRGRVHAPLRRCPAAGESSRLAPGAVANWPYLEGGMLRPLVSEVFGAWHEAARLAARARPGSPEHDLAVDASCKLGQLFRELTALPERRLYRPRLRKMVGRIRRTIAGRPRGSAARRP